MTKTLEKAEEKEKAKAFAEVEKLGMIVEITERVVKDRWVWILGSKFDAEDMYETLSEVLYYPSGTVMTEDQRENCEKNLKCQLTPHNGNI